MSQWLACIFSRKLSSVHWRPEVIISLQESQGGCRIIQLRDYLSKAHAHPAQMMTDCYSAQD